METHSNTNPTPARRVLGDLSPNVKPTGLSNTSISGKVLSGSPLKRSFTASIEGGHGFTYLKKRKLSSDKPTGQRPDTSNARQTVVPARSEDTEKSSQHVQQDATGHTDTPSITQLSPTEANTPTPSISAEDGNDSSEERESFSSLINYEPSSQHGPSSQPRSKLVFSGPSYAEMLRLRLRVAMFKVRTNQVNVPLGELRVNDAQNRSTERPTPAQVEEAVAALRKEAQLKDSVARQRLQPVTQLLPAPVLQPTTYSSRTVSDWRIPSSPPIAESSSDIPTPVTARRSTEELPDGA